MLTETHHLAATFADHSVDRDCELIVVNNFYQSVRVPVRGSPWPSLDLPTSAGGFFEWLAAEGMRITKAMIVAAQRAEFDVNQRMRTLDADRFVPSPTEVVRAMLKAALGAVEMEIRAKEARPEPSERPKLTIVTARRPGPRY